jgi:hypothetical protein
VDLAKYGNAKKDVFDSFTYCVQVRKEMTIKFLTDHYKKVNEENKRRSMISKTGGLIKTLIVYGVVAFILGTAVYSRYMEIYHPESTETIEVKRIKAKSKMTPTGEELARMAKEREEQEAAQRRKFEQEINETY